MDVNKKQFVEIIHWLSALRKAAPEITEMDINPFIGTQKAVTVVNARVIKSHSSVVKNLNNC